MNFKQVIKVIDILIKIRNLWNELGDNFRVIAYNSVINTIAKNGVKIGSINELEISDKMKEKVRKILHTGRLKEEKLLKKILRYKGIPGFGKKFQDDVLKGKKITLTKTQKLGLEYHKKIIKNLSRKDIKNIADKILRYLSKHILKFDITGGYRRKNFIMKDVDILVIPKKTGGLINDMLTRAQFFEKEISSGEQKISFLFKYKTKLVHIDIRYTNKIWYPYSKLYFTGSKLFNIKLRRKAKLLGLKLNEYGLFNKKTGSKILIKPETEIGIIKFLGFNVEKYKNPANRI